MKYHPKAVADIIENLRECAADDAILRYTLERLTLETPMNRKRVLDALKSGKAGRPNRLASTVAMFKEIEREIKHCGLELTTLKNRKVTEKEIIEWLIEKEVFVDASADLTRCAGFDLIRVRPMNALVSRLSALPL